MDVTARCWRSVRRVHWHQRVGNRDRRQQGL